MPIPSRITNHEEAAKARFISQFQSNRPVLHGLVGSFVEQIQALENATWDVINYRLLDPAPGESHGAQGAQLDVLGKIVGCPRRGLSDTAYRDAIRLQIKVNRSDGSNVDLLEILRLAMPLPKVFSFLEVTHLASYTYVDSIAPELAFTLINALFRARAAGYRAVLEYTTNAIAPSALFKFGTDDGTLGSNGFGNEGGATGGLLTSTQG